MTDVFDKPQSFMCVLRMYNVTIIFSLCSLVFFCFALDIFYILKLLSLNGNDLAIV